MATNEFAKFETTTYGSFFWVCKAEISRNLSIDCLPPAIFYPSPKLWYISVDICPNLYKCHWTPSVFYIKCDVTTEKNMFTKDSCIAKIKMLSDIFQPAKIFEEMFSTTDQNFSWAERVISLANSTDGNHPPHKFLKHQPEPTNGITCYFSVFSRKSE